MLRDFLVLFHINEFGKNPRLNGCFLKQQIIKIDLKRKDKWANNEINWEVFKKIYTHFYKQTNKPKEIHKNPSDAEQSRSSYMMWTCHFLHNLISCSSCSSSHLSNHTGFLAAALSFWNTLSLKHLYSLSKTRLHFVSLE